MTTIGFIRSEVTALSRGELSPEQVMDSINAHIEKRLQAERTRIAQSIEAAATEREHKIAAIAGVAGSRVTGTTAGMRLAARIARGES